MNREGLPVQGFRGTAECSGTVYFVLKCAYLRLRMKNGSQNGVGPVETH